MITRHPRVHALVALAVLSAASAACQKVPLLAPSGSTITLTALATALPSNGSTEIIAQVIEPAGTPPHAGTFVSFSTTLGTIQPATAETDINGQARVRFVAGGGSGTATITAISGGVSAGTNGALKIAVGAAAVSSITLSAAPVSLPASGGSSTISARVNDNGGNSLSGVPVTFSTDAGFFSTSVVDTDSTGVARTILTTSRTAKVTATAGVTSGSGTTATVAPTNTITVVVNAGATVVFGAFSPAAPVVGQPVSVTLTITPNATTGSSIRNVVVNFGDGQSQNLGAVSGAVPLSHTYNSQGTYTLTATVTDSNGDTFTGIAQIGVTAKPTPSVALAATPNPSTLAQQPVAFTATVTQLPTNVTVDHYEWNFGDNLATSTRSTTSNSTNHVYIAAGTYPASVTAVTSDGVRSTSSIDIKVN